MSSSHTTCWTMIDGAAADVGEHRDAFVLRYQDVVRAYLAARWGCTPLGQEIDDAAQEVFVECFRSGGVLDRADRTRPGGFRAFFLGVVRNVARRYEARRFDRRETQPASDFLERSPSADDEQRLSRIFDRAWARRIMQEAATRQRQWADAADEDARRRVELLRLRFAEGLPIRDIAHRWGTDPASLHRAYARARQDFRRALEETVAFYHPGDPDAVTGECAELLSML